MNLSIELKDYLKQSNKNLNSNILCTDLSNILFSATDTDNEYFNDKKISNELLTIIKNWKDASHKEELIIICNLYCIPITQNDTNNYYSQIILPICHSDKLDGILIFYRKDRNYIPSSAKSAITTKEFTEKLSDINFQ